METTNPSKTLVETASDTRKLFRNVIALNISAENAIPQWPGSELAAEADRFELWSTNLGLFVAGHGSLDYRVRQADGIRAALLKFITDLNESLAEGWFPWITYEVTNTMGTSLNILSASPRVLCQRACIIIDRCDQSIRCCYRSLQRRGRRCRYGPASGKRSRSH